MLTSLVKKKAFRMLQVPLKALILTNLTLRLHIHISVKH